MTFAQSFITFVLLAGALLSTGCIGYPLSFISGSGQTVSTDYDFADFDKVSVSHAFTTVINQGAAYAVKVTVDDNIVDKLIVEERSGTLVVSLRPGAYNTLTLRAEITMPALAGVNLSGASSAAITGFSGGGEFEGVLSGASSASGDLSANSMLLDLSGASRITLSGEGESLNARASGASRLNLGDYAVQTATVSVSGASSALINVSEELGATASGASTVEYVGNPARVRENSSGASSIRER